MASSTMITLFLCVTLICVVVIAVYAVRLLISLTNLSNNANIIATSVQQEIEPTLKELKEAAKSLNSIANNADIKFNSAKVNVASILGGASCIGGKLKSFSKGILKGISFGLSLFSKK